MEGPVRERWRVLCERVAEEKEPGRFIALVAEINRLLDEQQDRLLEMGDTPSARCV